MRRVPLLLLLLTACHLGPRYKVPDLPVPGEWKAQVAQQEGPLVEVWWDLFQDPLLSELEKKVLADNPNLYTAYHKIEEARALSGMAKAELYPQASLQPSFDEKGELIKLYGVPQNTFPGLKTLTRVRELSFALPAVMSYEADIWDKRRGVYNSADKNTQAQYEAYRAQILTLTTELASHYFNARTLDVDIDLMGQLVDCEGELLRFHQVRYLVGIDSYLDVLTAIEQFEESQAVYEDLVRQRNQLENAIAVLVGDNASSFTLEKGTLCMHIPHIPAGLPSTVLMRRPDVAEAERSMASMHDLIGSAYATFFPTITLTSALGFLSPELDKFLTWKGHLWDWGVKIFQTLFDGGLRSSALDAAYALYREKEGAYKNTVLTAFQEVENALNDLAQESKQAEDLFIAYQSAETILHLYQQRFAAGASSQLELLSKKISELKTQLSWVNIQGLRYQATLQLIKSLGGGWQEKAAALELQ